MRVKGSDNALGRATVPCNFPKKPLNFGWRKGAANRLKGEEGAIGLEEMAEKKDYTEKVTEGEMAHVMESLPVTESWNCWRIAESSAYS